MEVNESPVPSVTTENVFARMMREAKARHQLEVSSVHLSLAPTGQLMIPDLNSIARRFWNLRACRTHLP